MTKPEQVLVLEPREELRFRGPFTDVVTTNLRLTNPLKRKVCFKVKTTTPRRYCVRPNSGIIDPGSAVDVSIMLQPFEYDSNESLKHKFMVMSMIAPYDMSDLETVWKEAVPEEIMDTRLRCTFDVPGPEESSASNPSVSSLSPVKGEREPSSLLPKSSSSSLDDGEAKKILEECKRLQEEVQQLKDDNRRIRDRGGFRPNSSAVSDHAMIARVLCVVFFIVGLIVGKVML